MRQLALLGPILLCVAASGQSVSPQGAAIPAGWKKLYDDMAQTIVKKDVKGYMAYLDKGFVNIKQGKPTNFADYEKGFGDFLSKFSNIKVSLTGTNLRKKGDVAIVDYHYKFSGSTMVANKSRVVSFSEDGSDTWGLVHGKYFQFIENVKQQKLLSR